MNYAICCYIEYKKSYYFVEQGNQSIQVSFLLKLIWRCGGVNKASCVGISSFLPHDCTLLLSCSELGNKAVLLTVLPR